MTEPDHTQTARIPYFKPRAGDSTIVVNGCECEVYGGECVDCDKWMIKFAAKSNCRCKCGGLVKMWRLRAGDITNSAHVMQMVLSVQSDDSGYLMQWLTC
jgi:hypothetical protein